MTRVPRRVSWTVLAFFLIASQVARAAPNVVSVDCNKGENLAKALEHASPGLVIELRGMCHEDVVVRTDGLTIRGADPWATDGVHPRRAGIPVYGVPAVFTEIDPVRSHGKDERVGVEAFYEGLEFMYRLMKTRTAD